MAQIIGTPNATRAVTLGVGNATHYFTSQARAFALAFQIKSYIFSLPPYLDVNVTVVRVSDDDANVTVTFPPGANGTAGALALVAGASRAHSPLMQRLQNATGSSHVATLSLGLVVASGMRAPPHRHSPPQPPR